MAQRFLAEYPAEDILPLLGAPTKHVFTLPNGTEYKVKVSTERLLCLKRSQECVWCGRTGSRFALEFNGRESPHLNLYHITEGGAYVLMTQDHIIPKMRGGKSTLDNLWTMCERCNRTKGELIPLYFVCKETEWLSWPIIKRREKELAVARASK